MNNVKSLVIITHLCRSIRYYQKQASDLSRTSNWKYTKEKKRTKEEPTTEAEGKP
ncbi:MAG: hypothetical protein P4M12_02025 [Gammaproteobacteria bacterium]|nr:hypothetical protein [Gammaproteobacteria bacterium]